jgi:hypothetical protein
MDLIAVDRAEIIAVEIKSAKDKLDRLDAQVKAMKTCAHHSVAAIHEKFLVEQKTNQGAAHYQRGEEFFMKVVPAGVSGGAHEVWVFPEKRRAMLPESQRGWDSIEKWRLPAQSLERPLPSGALNLLWRDELYNLCSALNVSATRRSTLAEMQSALRWYCNGKELTLGICKILRIRTCTEADAPIFEGAA